TAVIGAATGLAAPGPETARAPPGPAIGWPAAPGPAPGWAGSPAPASPAAAPSMRALAAWAASMAAVAAATTADIADTRQRSGPREPASISGSARLHRRQQVGGIEPEFVKRHVVEAEIGRRRLD